MTDLPAPLTPADSDLTRFPYMPLDVARLRSSDLASIATAEAFRAAVLLWCACWHQKPAASLPDDDRVLAQFAGFGRFVKEWAKVRDEALRGFVKCSDGRLYHKVVSEKANEAWRQKEAQRARTEAARQAQLQRSDKTSDKASNRQPEPPVTDTSKTLLQAPTEKEKEKDSPLSPPRGKASAIKSDWIPRDETRDYARRLGFEAWEIEAAAIEFREYWSSRSDKTSRRADWDLTFKTRLRDIAADPKQRNKLKLVQRANGAANGSAPIDWAFRLDYWRTERQWPAQWGPEPGKPGFLGPSTPDLFAEGAHP